MIFVCVASSSRWLYVCEENRIKVESVCNVVLVRGKKDPKSFQVIKWILQSFCNLAPGAILYCISRYACIVLSAKCELQSDGIDKY